MRKRLQCKSFQWYLDNVFPEHQLPKTIKDIGQIRNVETNKCMDSMAGTTVNMQDCHGSGGAQLFLLSNINELKSGGKCIDAPSKNSAVIFIECHRSHGNQDWLYNQTVRWLCF